ncbi:jg26059, partial [Pararge aegeria aegeria]
AADAEVVSSGRSFEELPSKLGREVELSLTAVTDLVENGVAR